MPEKTLGGSKGQSWCGAGSGSVSLGRLRPLCSGFVPFRRDLAEGLGTSDSRLSPVVPLSCSGQAGGVSEPPDTIRFALQSGQFNEDMIPTVGFNMRKITKGNVTIKVGHRKKTQGGDLGMGLGRRRACGLCWGLKEAAIRGICPLGCADTLWRRLWGWRRSESPQQEPGCTAGGFILLLARWQGPADTVTSLRGGSGLVAGVGTLQSKGRGEPCPSWVLQVPRLQEEVAVGRVPAAAAQSEAGRASLPAAALRRAKPSALSCQMHPLGSRGGGHGEETPRFGQGRSPYNWRLVAPR